jgi:hypothetical protein
MQWIKDHYVPDPQRVDGGFEELFLPSPFEDEEDKPMPCGWKVNGESSFNESTKVEYGVVF